MARRLRISLAVKCQLLFGFAVVLLLVAALTVIWFRMHRLVIDGQQEKASLLADAFVARALMPAGEATARDPAQLATIMQQTARLGGGGVAMTLLEPDQWATRAAKDAQLRATIERFESREDVRDRFIESSGEREADGHRAFRYFRAIRQSDLSPADPPTVTREGPPADEAGTAPGDDGAGAAAEAVPTEPVSVAALGDPLRMILLVEFDSALAQRQFVLNRIYAIAAGLFAGLLAIAIFWVLTTRIILQPVRVLRDTAEKVVEGDLNIRADVSTGDEFEQLCDMFNAMLHSLKQNQDDLRAINKSLDMKLGKLTESNVALFEANKIKGEFLANVSHELRTPLNSIIGFAELLSESTADTPQLVEKRKRYLNHIITSSRRLLDLINDLLDLAKIEAGRIDLRITPVSISDTAEGLLTLVRPLAAKQDIDLRLKVPTTIPLVHTDASKLQQILFNFLSNAVKFTPARGSVTLGAHVLDPDEDEQAQHVVISVSDTGPGIAIENQQRIFEKFTQLDTGVTKEHGGTGLGLTICKELAELLHGRITVESDTGRGATFNLIVPVVTPSRSAPLMPAGSGSTGDA